LKDAIVLRRDASNADYFTNAGSTKQKGIESQISYLFFENKTTMISRAKLWLAYTMNDFTYDDFKQTTNDYSGNKIPSVSPNTFVSGVDIYSKPGIYTNITYYYSDKIALNDANSEFASFYNLLGLRIGCKKSIRQKHIIDFFAGIDNLLNEKYSLGNDINAAGGRYFNAAAERNYYIGISFKIL
jgi:iron complex outermembrane receptor protein